MALTLIGVRTILAATHNPGKARELAALLEGRFQVLHAGALGLPEPEETESTFVGNALLKARQAADLSGEIALADDSGLSAWGLGGDPGIYSARWAGPDKDFFKAMSDVEDQLIKSGTKDRTASFFCALAVAWPKGPAVVVEGRIDGSVTFPPRGDRGFGYDPIFIADGHDLTFGEMEPRLKDVMSHRARAFEKLTAALL
jgi:XTP/dITP diphosphohydrolase